MQSRGGQTSKGRPPARLSPCWCVSSSGGFRSLEKSREGLFAAACLLGRACLGLVSLCLIEFCGGTAAVSTSKSDSVCASKSEVLGAPTLNRHYRARVQEGTMLCPLPLVHASPCEGRLCAPFTEAKTEALSLWPGLPHTTARPPQVTGRLWASVFLRKSTAHGSCPEDSV